MFGKTEKTRNLYGACEKMKEKDVKKIQDFVEASERFLDSLGIAALRAYGRHVGVARATAKKKNEIIEEIIAIFCGQLEPIERSNRGAPIRDDSFDPKIEQTMNGFRYAHLLDVEGTLPFEPQNDPLDWGVVLKESKKRAWFLEVSDNEPGEYVNGVQKIYVGQLATLNQVSLLLPLDCSDSDEKIVLSVEFIRKFNLREGDVISCHCKTTRDIYVATRILTVNGIEAEHFHRNPFEAMDVVYPSARIHTYDKTEFHKIEHKFTQWLIPFGKGQRGVVISAPKAGKTQYLLSLIQAVKGLNEGMETYVLLVDQPLETVGAFRKAVGSENLLYTTYEDEPDRQIFVADFLMKRAKCQVESGKDVVVFIDSFNALARAYNDTEESSGGKRFSNGLESKTLHYIKKYLGAARQTDKKGSLTILGSVVIGTGNPADEMIASELCSVASLEIGLSNDLAFKRIFPALDVTELRSKNGEYIQTDREMQVSGEVYRQRTNGRGANEILLLLQNSDDFEEFANKI